jgi:hypothetical protein
MDLEEESVETTVSDSDLAISIIILTILGGLIILNITLYLICRRITRLKLKVHDMEISVSPQSPAESRDVVLIEADSTIRSESQTELRCFNEINDLRRSYSESCLTNYN